MKRPILKHALLSRLLVGLLIAGLAVQWTTNAVGMGRGGAEVEIAAVVSSDNAVDQVLADLVLSICAKDRADGGQTKADHCQHCVPAAFQILAVPGFNAALPLAMVAPIRLASHSQIPPSSRRLPGDGSSRAPPSIV